MKFRNLTLVVGMLSLAPGAFAMTGAICKEVNESASEAEDGFSIEIRGSDKNPDKVLWAKMSDPGHSDIKLKSSYYDLNMRGDGKDHLSFGSNETIQGTRDSHLARVVTLYVKFDGGTQKTWTGQAKITKLDLKGIEDADVESYAVQCSVK